QILHLQEAIMASIITSQSSSEATHETHLSKKQKTTHETLIGPEDSKQIKAEPCDSSLTCCEICFESKEGERIHSIDGCIHSFCIDCIGKHVVAKIELGICNITCLGLNCNSVLQPETFMTILDKEVIDLWGEALCKSLIDGSHQLYCPFEDCSAVLINDTEKCSRECECPLCHRQFCLQCKVPWHSGVECEEYQKLDADERGVGDLMLRELVKEEKWSRCPKCNFYVERTSGCNNMRCRQVNIITAVVIAILCTANRLWVYSTYNC
ncbi:IBR domain-containing protein, partial [Cephalotus follicularis]